MSSLSNIQINNKLSLQKSVVMDPKTKQERIQSALKFFKEMAESNTISKPLNEIKFLRAFRLSLKDGKKRVEILFEYAVHEQLLQSGKHLWNYKENRFDPAVTASCLYIDKKKYLLTIKGTNEIRSWMEHEYVYPTIPLNGNRFEYIHFGDVKVCENSFWNRWKDKYEEITNVYQLAYKICCKYLEILPLSNNISILEICSGDGEFASLAFTSLKTKIVHYVCIDQNKESLRKASLTLSTQIMEKKATIIEADVTSYDFNNLNHSFDLVIGIGAVTKGVLKTRSMGLDVVQRASKLIKKDGFLLLTGYEKLWVDSKDLVQCGLEVKNTFSTLLERQFYLAKKL